MLKTIGIGVALSITIFGMTARCHAETPQFSVTVKADDETTFKSLLPIIELIKEEQLFLTISFEHNHRPGVEIVVSMRSDVILMDLKSIEEMAYDKTSIAEPNVLHYPKEILDDFASRLRKLGADSVRIEVIDYMPTRKFSIEGVEKLRKEGRRVVLICHADWDLESLGIEKHLLLNSDAIAAVKKSKTAVVMADWTHRLGEKETEFFRALEANVLTFIVFAAEVEKPVLVRGELEANEFIKLLSREE